MAQMVVKDIRCMGKLDNGRLAGFAGSTGHAKKVNP